MVIAFNQFRQPIVSDDVEVTEVGFGWSFKASDSIEWEIVVRYSAGQDGTAPYIVVLLSIDGGMQVVTGKASLESLSDVLEAAIRKITSHWINPINSVVSGTKVRAVTVKPTIRMDIESPSVVSHDAIVNQVYGCLSRTLQGDPITAWEIDESDVTVDLTEPEEPE